MHDDNAIASIISAANNNIELLQKLITKAPSDLKIAWSLNSIQSQLTALLSAMAIDDGSQLSEKESIAPNQHTWPETVVRMGEKCGTKHSWGKVDCALMAQHIGEPNHKHMTDNDPYGAGEQSGKHAKPDARSANANAWARKAVEWEALKAEPPLPPASQPLPTLLPLLLRPWAYLVGTCLCCTYILPYMTRVNWLCVPPVRLTPIPDISAISILSCFRSIDVSWLTFLLELPFARSCHSPSSPAFPPILARVSQIGSYY